MPTWFETDEAAMWLFIVIAVSIMTICACACPPLALPSLGIELLFATGMLVRQVRRDRATYRKWLERKGGGE